MKYIIGRETGNTVYCGFTKYMKTLKLVNFNDCFKFKNTIIMLFICWEVRIQKDY